MANVKRMVTPKGEALYPKLKTVDMYEGNPIGYTIQLKLNKKDGDKLIADLNAILEEAKNSEQFKGKKWSKEPILGYREDDNGGYIFKFKMKHEFTDKEGNTIKRTVPIVDAHNEPIDVDLGSGSIVRVSFTPIVFHTNAMMNGLTLRLNAVQVLELKEYSGSNNFGFPVEEDIIDDPFAD